MIKVLYKHEIEPERNKELEFKYIKDLITHIQEETCEFTGDEDKKPSDMVVLNDDLTYYEEGFGKYHSWTIIKLLNILSGFSGIGADRKAFNEVGIKGNYEIIEIDKAAVKSYNAIFKENHEPASIVGYIPKMKDIDIFFHGSPCQDFSRGGYMKGAEKDSGTRSSLLWESLRIVELRKPKVVIWENVRNVFKNKAFHEYLAEMESLGYTNKWELHNTGELHDRERVLCISKLN